MSVTVLGIDIAKQKFDVALLADGKTKHKTCKNSIEGFEILDDLAGETGNSKRFMPVWKQLATMEKI